MPSANRKKGKGWFVNEHGIIYVQGSIDGKFVRKSTKMPWNKKNEKYINRNAREVLLELVKAESQQLNDFASFARKVIAAGAKRPGKRGGRGAHAQKEAEAKLERFVIPRFDESGIEAIRVHHIEEWIDHLLRVEGYSTSTVSKCVSLLREVMHKAVANQIVTMNPVEYIDPVEVTTTRQEAYTVEEARRMINESEGWMHRYLLLAFTTGMRTGEMLALRWEDVDWDRAVIYLQRSVTRGVITIGTNGHKNHNRVVPIMPQAMAMLREAKATSASEWILPNTRGKCYTESRHIREKMFRPLLEKLGIQYRTIYATRHTFATMASNAMVDAKSLDAIVGNTEQVRADHYVTFQVTDARAAAAHQAAAPVNNILFDDVREEKAK